MSGNDLFCQKIIQVFCERAPFFVINSEHLFWSTRVVGLMLRITRRHQLIHMWWQQPVELHHRSSFYWWVSVVRPSSAEASVGPDLPYLSLDHVDPPWAQLPDAVVNIHHTLSLRHVQHDVDDDEAACPSRPSTAGKHKQKALYSEEWDT